MNKIEALRKLLDQHQIDGFLIPSSDEFFNEYCPPYAKRLEWFTEFTGSYGIALILKDENILFTDGRYILQAKQQLGSKYKVINMAESTPWNYLKEELNIGFDAKLMSLASSEKYKCQLIPTDNLIDKIWTEKPVKDISQIFKYPESCSGENIESKINRVEFDADALIITLPESICWLLNIRAHDIPYTPFLLSYAILYKNGEIEVFADNKVELGTKIKFKKFEELEAALRKLKNKKVQIDPFESSVWLINCLENSEIMYEPDPIVNLKSIKNDIEISKNKEIHIQDAIAVINLLAWLDNNSNQDEISVADKLLEFRKLSPDFIYPSFSTICGFNANGAIIHYSASIESNKKIENDGILLLDSGGQYFGGTTDITRTIAIGKPTKDQKKSFTLVLKGHIALSNAKWPSYVTGAQLDVLARMYLWRENLDYDHGTGHGVGNCLSVHEGPQRITKNYSHPLKANMISSNEPGLYIENQYGIRIENLVFVKKAENNCLEFENLTLVPIDKNLIEKDLLNKEEIEWLDNYHHKIYQIMEKRIDDKELLLWLKEATNKL